MRINRASAAMIVALVCVTIIGWRGITSAQTPDTAAAAPGAIGGKVIDKASGEPIIDAGVEVIGTGKKIRTDLDGKFKVSLPPGRYEVRFFAPLYQGTRIQNVVVQSAQTATTDTALAPQGQGAMQVVEVVAQADKAAEATQMIQRKSAAVVSDNISAETIKKSTGSTAGDVMARVPAVTVKDSKFIVVRGLNERYTSALLNGSRLPSTDPERRVVPLDLFPASFIESISLLKSYSPDLPGDFSGGLASISLRDHPDSPMLNIGLNTEYNPQTTFKTFRTYHAGGTEEYFGFGAASRALPSNFPDRLQAGAPAQRQAYGQSLKDIWTPSTQSAVPGIGINFSAGNQWGPIGASLSGIYGTNYKTRNHQLERQFINANTSGQGEILKNDDFAYDFDTFETRLGGVLTSAYHLSDDHKFALRSFVNRNSTDEVAVGTGTCGNGACSNSTGLRQTTKLTFKEDLLAFGQLAGDHHFSLVDVSWRTAFSETTSDQPDTRIITRESIDQTPYGSYSNDGSGGTRFYANLNETLTDSAVDFTVPFKVTMPYTELWDGMLAKFKFGPSFAYRDRDFSLRRFQYQLSHTEFIPPGLLLEPTEQILAPENIGFGRGIDFKEETLPGETFKATHEIAAGYGQFDLPLFPGIRNDQGQREHAVRLNAGVRTEYSYIALNTTDQSGRPYFPKKNTLDALPGINLVYSPREDMNVRFGYSEAVARPEFRELSPVLYPEARGLRPKQGNPDLVQAQIRSLDLRWEWFLSGSDIVSFSLFQKHLDKPIEQTVVQNGSSLIDSFSNADNGDLLGFEFEGRKGLDFLSPSLDGLSLSTNVSYVDSTVNVPLGVAQQQTETKRALQGQAPFVVNAGLEYTTKQLGTARLLYNTAERRIDKVGASGLPDIYEERRDQLDFVLTRKIEEFGTPFNLKLGIENLLNDNYLFSQGDNLQRRYRTGVRFALGVSYTYQ